jgi:flagellin-like protein
MNILQKRKAVSPVIATVILVAVAITVAVGVSYWMGGISAQYTQFEKIEVQTGYSEWTTDAAAVPASGWNITLELKNTGSAASTITHVFVNDKPVPLEAAYVDEFDTVDGLRTSILETGLLLEAGQSKDMCILIDDEYENLSSGTTVNVKLHSAGGMDYIKLIRLT